MAKSLVSCFLTHGVETFPQSQNTADYQEKSTFYDLLWVTLKIISSVALLSKRSFLRSVGQSVSSRCVAISETIITNDDTASNKLIRTFNYQEASLGPTASAEDLVSICEWSRVSDLMKWMILPAAAAEMVHRCEHGVANISQAGHLGARNLRASILSTECHHYTHCDTLGNAWRSWKASLICRTEPQIRKNSEVNKEQNWLRRWPTTPSLFYSCL